jgi:hypothetical protein
MKNVLMAIAALLTTTVVFSAPKVSIAEPLYDALESEILVGRSLEEASDIDSLSFVQRAGSTYYCCVTLYRECAYDKNTNPPALKDKRGLALGKNADGTEKMVAETGKGGSNSDKSTPRTTVKNAGTQKNGDFVSRYSKTSCEAVTVPATGLSGICVGKPSAPSQPADCVDPRPADGTQLN